MKKIILFYLALCLWLISFTALAESINLLDSTLGYNELTFGPAENSDKTTTKEFIPFNKAFKISKNIAAFKVPQAAGKLGYRYTGIGPVKVKGGHKYRLIMDINRGYGDFNTLICASFLKSNKIFQFDNISSGNIISRSGFIKIEQISIVEL